MSIVLVSGITGIGKTTLINKLISSFSNYQRPLAYTTRKKRECEDAQFCYVSNNEMDSLLRNNKLLTYDIVHNHKYGLSRASVKQISNLGKIVIKEFYISNIAQLKLNYNQVCSVVIVPSSIQSYRNHIESTQSTKERAKLRIKTELSIHQELIDKGVADILIVNDFSLSMEKIAVVLNTEIEYFFKGQTY